MNTVSAAEMQIKEFLFALSDLAFNACDDETASLDQKNWLYAAAQSLVPQLSQVLGKSYVIEGKVSVYNDRNMIKIGDFPILKHTAFEVQNAEGAWLKGYLENGAYGMYLAGSGETIILTNDMTARLSFPLTTNT